MSAVAHSMNAAGEGAASARSRLVVAEPFATALSAAGIETPSDLFNLSGGQQLHKKTLPVWRQRARIRVPGIGPCYLKRYTSPPVAAQFGRVVSGPASTSTAGAEWDQIHRLEVAGISSLVPVAFADSMAGPWERCSALLTAELPGESLERYVQSQPGRASHKWIRTLADFVARFHAAGFVHRDLYLCHVFVEVIDGVPNFRLIDLARMFKPRWRRRRWIIKDLASLNYSTPQGIATATDRLRFLKVYLGENRLGREGGALARQIGRKTRRIARHDARIRAATRSPA